MKISYRPAALLLPLPLLFADVHQAHAGLSHAQQLPGVDAPHQSILDKAVRGNIHVRAAALGTWGAGC